MAKLKIEIVVDDKGTVQFKRFGRVIDATDQKMHRYARSLGRPTAKMKGLAASTALTVGKTLALGSAVGIAAGAFAAWKIKDLGMSFIRVGSSMDQMKISLDTITKGRGDEWFQRLNEWALKMPVNTTKAIEAFTGMRAMGLQPTIEDMTTLVDTTSALGGGSDVLMGIARALGQIQTKGKVATEELYQLAERGVPAFDILRDKLGLTSEQLGDIGRQGLDAGKTIRALIEGMADRFGGQSAKIQDKWAGLTEALKSYWVEFQRLVMESGVMEFLEDNLRSLRDWVDELNRSGTLREWAKSVSDWVVELGNDIKDFVGRAIGDWDSLDEKIEEFFTDVKYWVGLVTPILKGFLGMIEGALKLYNQMVVNYRSIPGPLERAAIGDAEMPGFQTGTGPAGLPSTGLFYGHKGEIVLNPVQSNVVRRLSPVRSSPVQSNVMRRGNGGDIYNYNFHLQTWAADPASIRNAAEIFGRAIKEQSQRWGGEYDDLDR